MSREFWYEDTIRSHPGAFFGVWTPEGWRTHKKEEKSTFPCSVEFSGDGERAQFHSPLLSQADVTVHDSGDPATDRGIYPSEPRVHYPPGRARWAVSHTYLAYPHADQTLYAQEYVYDVGAGSVTTHFRKHVILEEAYTDDDKGTTVRIANRPISRVVVGNKSYDLCNSAVRGVWTDPEKQGPNLYIKEHLRLVKSLNAIYIPVDQQPVVQCAGVWKAEARDLPAFDHDGVCICPDLLRANGIPIDCPKLGSAGYRPCQEWSDFYQSEVDVMDPQDVLISGDWLAKLRACRNVPFQEHQVGFAKWQCWDHWSHIYGVPGHYGVHWDFNGNGVVDGDDERTLSANIGRLVRPNYYSAAYYGNDWLSTGLLLNAEMHVQVPVICAWSQGAGYDAPSGSINLFESPGPGQKVYVEYHYDSPAEPGDTNVLVGYRKEQ